MEYTFFLDDLPISEIISWDEFELSMRRDDKTHGIQFEASTGTLKFYGAAANYLIDKKETEGIKANVVFTARQYCENPYDPIEEITGRLNFGKFKSTCGDQCTVDIPLEEEGCKVIFKNKYDQKVDLDNDTAFDGITPLPEYAALGIEIDMPAKALQAAVDGSVAEDGFDLNVVEPTVAGAAFYVRPNYDIQRYNSIQTGQLIAVSNADNNEGPDLPVTPQVLFEDIITCFAGDFQYSGRQKGRFTATASTFALMAEVAHRVVRWDGVGNIFTDGDIIFENVLFAPPNPDDWPPLPQTFEFDSTLSGTIALTEGQALYDLLFMNFPAIAGTPTITIDTHWDTESFFTLSAVKLCPATTAPVYLIHETLSRTAEAITDGCVRVKSSYYGRIDSQPFAFDSDGCGGLRLLTSGLKIRNAPDGKFFASMKDLYEGLNPIDNIGFDIITDPDDFRRYIMRIEQVGFFYQDDEIFIIDHIPEATSDVQEQMHYSKILVGYKKWEVEGVNGLDEFNSNREYRTSLDTVNSTLDITSALIAGSYPIEITRQQNFADSGAADTKFDNDIFIITLLRNAYDFVVEQDNVSDATGFFDPDTIYNAKLSPVRNLMRWYKTIAAGYANLSDSDNKLWFSAGTGNFNAVMEIIEGAYDQLCKMENMPIAENQNLFVTHFARASDYTPLWQNETIAFDYPLNVAEYKSLKENPYGYISLRCGNSGDFEKAYIKEIKFKPAKGLATFSLIKKWE